MFVSFIWGLPNPRLGNEPFPKFLSSHSTVDTYCEGVHEFKIAIAEYFSKQIYFYSTG